jgi:septum formation protein
MISTAMTSDTTLILASSSPYRKALLQRLGLNFQVVSPDIDEKAEPGEVPEVTVQRLATAKAAAVSAAHPAALIIASDQVAVLGGEVLTKPVSRDRARQQLNAMAGHRVTFLTGLCVLNTARDRKKTACVPFAVVFRRYTADEIERYLDAEAPYDCAGSFKSEQLGIALVEEMDGPDPTALIGLPLIRLAQMLREEGLSIP